MSFLPYFLTVDTETDLMEAGNAAISRIRDEVAEAYGISIPIVWFVRFQRGWQETVDNDSINFFRGPLGRHFDGFQLAKSQLKAFQARGDEIAWHYHAYNYTERKDLSHDHRIDLLKADLESCSAVFRERHVEFDIQSFRFGWYLIPDYEIFTCLKGLGINADASINPLKAGKMHSSGVKFLPARFTEITGKNGMYFFPKIKTMSLHDWELVPHDFGWTSQGVSEAEKRQQEFKRRLSDMAESALGKDGRFITYLEYLNDHTIQT